jgi:hypothetical protein
VAITIGVLSLDSRSVFWTAPGPSTNSVLDAMQFAAKVHESLTAVSLFHVVIHYLRRDLLGSRGVPLGLLSSGFNSPPLHICSAPNSGVVYVLKVNEPFGEHRLCLSF